MMDLDTHGGTQYGSIPYVMWGATPNDKMEIIQRAFRCFQARKEVAQLMMLKVSRFYDQESGCDYYYDWITVS